MAGKTVAGGVIGGLLGAIVAYINFNTLSEPLSLAIIVGMVICGGFVAKAY